MGYHPASFPLAPNRRPFIRSLKKRRRIDDRPLTSTTTLAWSSNAVTVSVIPGEWEDEGPRAVLVLDSTFLQVLTNDRGPLIVQGSLEAVRLV